MLKFHVERLTNLSGCSSRKPRLEGRLRELVGSRLFACALSAFNISHLSGDCCTASDRPSSEFSS